MASMRVLGQASRVICGAITRGTGKACRRSPTRGSDRCANHGGVSVDEVGVVLDKRGRESMSRFVSADSDLGKALTAVEGDSGDRLGLDSEIDLVRALNLLYMRLHEVGQVELPELAEATARLLTILNTLVRTKHASEDRLNAMVSRDEVNDMLQRIGVVLEKELKAPCDECGMITGLFERVKGQMEREIKNI